jgi:hypothetical protein
MPELDDDDEGDAAMLPLPIIAAAFALLSRASTLAYSVALRP